MTAKARRPRTKRTGIPVVEKEIAENDAVRKVYVPSLIFGELRSGSNFDDSRERYVGGRNGYGAKLANVFSKEFSLETASTEVHLKLAQTWRENMSIAGTPKISAYKNKKGYCKISVLPDYARFGMEGLTDATYAWLQTRAYDMAACTGAQVQVYFNDERIGIKKFPQYASLFLDESRFAHFAIEKDGVTRLEVCAALSDGFQTHGFVNGLCCPQGRHVQYLSDKLCDALQKKQDAKRGSVAVPSRHIKAHLFLLVKAVINQPKFSTQTKEELTSLYKEWGFEVQLPDAFVNRVEAMVMPSAIEFAQLKAKQSTIRAANADLSSGGRVVTVDKLDDALNARKRNNRCALILTEGDSAKALALAGLSVIGRENYGVFPLRGKLLNVRQATPEQITGNAELMNIMKILGLRYGHRYTEADMKELRYGDGVIGFTDQDHDGAHIFGLILNFFEHCFPEILALRPNFIRRFATPIVKAIPNSAATAKEPAYFLSMAEFQRWEGGQTLTKWTLKWLKGLASSTASEAKRYFRAFEKHIIVVTTRDAHEILELVFAKKREEDRKQWLATYDPQSYVDYSQRSICTTEYMNQEYIHYSFVDNLRNLPSAIDGLKESQRKIVFAMLAKNVTKDYKCQDLVGMISQRSGYHHAGASLFGALVALAQCHHGTNNINVVHGEGMFGSRLDPRDKHGADRYVFARVEPIARAVFPEEDDAVLEYMNSDGKEVEPKHFLPVLPWLLVNGNHGIGTGWSCDVPSYHPLAICAAVEARLRGQALPPPLEPWFDLFHGTVVKEDERGAKFSVRGCYEIVERDAQGPTRIRITELPPGKWRDVQLADYKKYMLGRGAKEETGKAKRQRRTTEFIKEILNRSTELDVDIELLVDSEAFTSAGATSEAAIYKVLGLEITLHASNMYCLVDERPQKFESPEAIIDHYIPHRIACYERRIAHELSVTEAQLLKIANQLRFLEAVLSGEITFRSGKAVKKLVAFEKELARLKYDRIEGSYSYLLGLSYMQQTAEKLAEMKKRHSALAQRKKQLESTTAVALWLEEIARFRAEYALFLRRKQEVLAQDE